MKIGLAVTEFFTNKIDKNIEQIDLAAIEAKNQGVDLLCFGEAVLQGFFTLNGDFERDKKIAVSLNSSPIEKIKEIAEKHSVALAVGYLEYESGSIYSSYLVVDKTGHIINNYRRVSEGWKEPLWDSRYKEGAKFLPFIFGGKKIAAGLCGDFWTDDKFLSALQVLNVDIILWPVFIDSSYSEWETTAISEYADQSAKVGKQVLLINSILNEENIACGRAVYFKDGKISSGLDFGKSGILVCDIK